MLSFLATLLIKVAVFILLLLALLYGTKRLSSRDKFVAMIFALGILTVLPCLQLVMPSYHIPVDWLSANSERANEAVTTVLEISAETTASGDQSDVVATGLLVGYLSVAGFLLLRLAIGLVRTQREIHRYPLMDCPDALAILQSLAQRLDLQSPELRVDKTGAGPYVWGIGKPIIVVPAEFAGVSAAVQRTVLTHELIHIQRRDTLTCIASKILCCLYWINPAVWLLERRLKLEMEKSCDQQAVSFGVSAAEYAEQLLEAIKQLNITQRQPSYTVAMARASSLQQRIHSLLSDHEQRGFMSKSTLTILGIGLLGVAMAIGACTTTPEPATVEANSAAYVPGKNRAADAAVLLRINRIDLDTDEVKLSKISLRNGLISIEGTSTSQKGVSGFMRKVDGAIGKARLVSVNKTVGDDFDFKMSLDNFDTYAPTAATR